VRLAMTNETNELPPIDIRPENISIRTKDWNDVFGTSGRIGDETLPFETSPPLSPKSDGQVSLQPAFRAFASLGSETRVDYAKFLEGLLRPIPVTRISLQFDSRTGDSLATFADVLLNTMSGWAELRGVQHNLDIRRFESSEERGFELTSVELRVPGLPRTLQFELWERVSKAAEDARHKVSATLGASPEGRAFRRATSSLTIGVVPW